VLSKAYVGPETSTAIFDDGFESGSFSKWTGTTVSTGETRSVINSVKHHGTYSGMYTSNGGGGTEYACTYKTVTSSAELYARGYFYISKSGIVDNYDRLFFIAFRAGSNAVAYAGWRKIGGVVKWCLLIKSGTSSVFAYSTATPALSKWYCVELHWKSGASNGLGELWVDGVRVCSITGKNTAYYGNVSQVRFGLPQVYNCASTTVYCDCAKVAKSYVGPES
jgi:hypothetical protein